MVFGEGPEQGVDRLLYGALTYTEDFVGSTHIPFAKALEEVVRISGLDEGLARESLLTRQRHTDDDWRYHVHSYPLRETRPTLEEAASRARVLSEALAWGRSDVIDGETAVVLLEYAEGRATYRDADLDGWDASVPEAALLPDGRIVGPDHWLKEERTSRPSMPPGRRRPTHPTSRPPDARAHQQEGRYRTAPPAPNTKGDSL